MRPAWTAAAALPGGDFPWDGVDQVRGELARRYPFLAEATHHRLVRAYGTLATEMLGDARGLAEMGRCFGASLTEREVDWLIRTEWARNADDVLWRRSKLGLRMTDVEVRTVADYMAR
jgi:glycerol-3-phosphate dehydrogenase